MQGKKRQMMFDKEYIENFNKCATQAVKTRNEVYFPERTVIVVTEEEAIALAHQMNYAGATVARYHLTRWLISKKIMVKGKEE